LLFIRVNNADSNGAGGTLATGVPLSLTTFSSISELTVTAGAAVAVYEVVDSNPNTVETAQIPVWVVANASPCTTTPTLPTFSPMIGPLSTVATATPTDPIPRFIATAAASDCTQLGDCTASYFPTLSVGATSLTFSAPSLGSAQSNSFTINNTGGGLLFYNLTVTYQSSPTGWLTVTPTSGQNAGTITVNASPAMLPQGTYNATINITGGNNQSAQIPVTFNVGPVGVTIQAVGNAASFQYGTVALGSYAVIFGLNLMSSTPPVVTFNGVSATVVYSSATQINVLVPTNLTNTISDVIVNAGGGMISSPFRISIGNAPGIFSNGLVNVADSQVNTAADPVVRGQFLTIYMTGLTLPLSGAVTVNIGSQTNLMPSYAGAQGTFSGLEQVNVTVPLALPATPNPVPVQVCVAGGAAPVCSNSVNVYIQ
jgi:uncharacterized protein (TIGR03437 family)